MPKADKKSSLMLQPTILHLAKNTTTFSLSDYFTYMLEIC